MYKLTTLITLLVLLLISSCMPVAATTVPTSAPTSVSTEQPSIPVTGVAVVQSIEIQILEGQPLQVNAILRGQLPDAGCTTISSVEQVRDGNTFRLVVSTQTDPAVACAQVLTPFAHTVSLDAAGLVPGEHLVHANGVEAAFDLPARDLSQFRQMLVDALNARDYSSLKSYMNDSFLIGYWESEGTTNSPDQAVEQLQRSLLNPSSPITSDPARNLVDLVGTDPALILGPNINEASPLFTSGWGTDGRDEAILFSARRPNGDLYWHGLLFARGGFARPAPAPTQPVDLNAYPTQVSYVMALQDVNIRSGPGTQFRILSFIAEGQTAKVTGVSSNGNWWRVICPDGSTGSCWVSALRTLTRPTDSPLPDTTAYPTQVKYVMAQRDITIYSGPSTQFSTVGFIAGGQTAQVTGVNASGTWWRVICPDNSMGSCWVSADRRDTRPADPIGKADVQSVEIQILESFPVQVNAVARGQLPDAGCTTIAGASQSRAGNVFTVVLTTRVDPTALCSQVITPFEYVIPLDVSSLLPAFYIVNVNGVEATFELPDMQPPQ